MRRKGVFEKITGVMGRTVTVHPKVVVLAFVVLTVLMAIPMTGIEMESDMDDFIPASEFQENEETILREINSTSTVVSIVEAEDGNVLDREGLLTLMDMEANIKGDAEVQPFLVSHKDPVLTIADPVEGWLRGASNGSCGIATAPDDMIEQAIAYALASPETGNLVSNGDGNVRDKCLLIVTMDSRLHSKAVKEGDESMEIAIEEDMEKAGGSGYKVYSLGGWNNDMSQKTQEDLSLLLPISLVLLVVILAVTLRSLVDVAISLVGLGSALVISFGLMVVTGIPFNQMTFFAPIMIMVLSIDYTIHILLRYKEEKEDRNGKAMEHTIRFLGVSVLLSALTTIVAFAANMLSTIPAVVSFGAFLAMGIAVSLAVMLLFVPSIKFLADGRKRAKARSKHITRSSRTRLTRVTHVTYNHPVVVVAIALLLTAGSYYLSTLVEKDLVPEDVLASDSEKLLMINTLSDDFDGIGMERVSVVVEGDIADPAVLLAIESAIRNIGDDEHVAKSNGVTQAFSIVQFVRAATSQMPELDTNGDGIPDTREGCLIVLTTLYQDGIPGIVAREDIHGLVSPDEGGFDMALIAVEAYDVEGMKCKELISEMEEDVEPLESAGAEVGFAGAVFERSAMMDAMTEGMARSTLLSLVLCTLMVIILFWSVRYGIVAAIPVMLVTLWIMGSIYLLGFSLNPVTATTTAMTIGIGIDYAIHLIERYRQEKRAGKGLQEALDVSLNSTGIALIASGSTTAAGFGVIGFSKVGIFNAFGVLAFLIIAYVLLVSILVLPALIVLSERMAIAFRANHPKGTLLPD